MATFPFDLTAISDAVIAPFGESVVYSPRTGSDRTITAEVDRTDRNVLEGVDRGTSPRFTITVRNHASLGILSTEINLGGDEIQVAPRLGQSAKWCRVLRIDSHDAGWLTLEVQ